MVVVRLLTALLRHQMRLVQEVVLANPTAVSKVMDLLQDRREVVRNEVSKDGWRKKSHRDGVYCARIIYLIFGCRIGEGLV